MEFRRALESAINQTYPGKEILVVDANAPGSPYSRGLAEDAAEYPCVRLLPSHGEDSCCRCRNRALEEVSGEYVVFMEGVDEWQPQKTAAQVQALADGSAACCANGILAVPDKTQNYASDVLFRAPGQDVWEWLTEKPVRSGSQVLYRTQALRRIGGFDERFRVYCDLDAILRLRDEANVVFLPEPLFHTVPPSDDQRRLHEFEDERHFMEKYRDLFLSQAGKASDYCLLLAKHSSGYYRWVLGGQYILLAFLRAPIHVTGKLMVSVLRRAGRFIRLSTLRISVAFSTAALLRTVRRRPGRAKAVLRHRGTKGARELSGLTAKQFAAFPAYRFARDRKLTSVTIPGGVSVIKRGTFYGCVNLARVVLPSTVEVIEPRAFQGCRHLTQCVFEPGGELQEIGAYAFAGCTYLTGLRLPGTLRRIGKAAFAGCEKCAGIEFGYMGDEGEFAKETFSDLIREIPAYAFAGCASLRAVGFEAGSMLDRIDEAAFLNCLNLENVRIMGTLTRIASFAFAGCRKMLAFEMPKIDTVQTVGAHAFERCESLRAAHIPYPLKRIEAGTYRGCKSLKTIRIPPNVEQIRKGAFAGCASLETALVLNAQATVYPSAFPKTTVIRKNKTNPDAAT